jgi:hypothetical protein
MLTVNLTSFHSVLTPLFCLQRTWRPAEMTANLHAVCFPHMHVFLVQSTCNALWYACLMRLELHRNTSFERHACAR